RPCTHAPQASPTNAAAPKAFLGRCMLKEQPGLSGELRHVKGILHQEQDIDIIGEGLGCHKRPEDHTASQMACGPRHVVHAFESQADQHALGRTAAKMLQHFCECRTVDTWRQITTRSEWGQRHKRSSSVSNQLCNISSSRIVAHHSGFGCRTPRFTCAGATDVVPSHRAPLPGVRGKRLIMIEASPPAYPSGMLALGKNHAR